MAVKNLHRPLFLTIWLIMLTFYTAWVILTTIPHLAKYNIDFWQQSLIDINLLTKIYFLVMLIQLVGIILLWNWRKIGFSLYAICIGVACLLHLISIGFNVFNLISIGTDILISIHAISLVILYIAMVPVWKNFK